MRTKFIFIFTLLLSIFMTSVSFAQFEDNDHPRVQATIISEIDAVQPGAPFWIGLHQKIEPGWHTYWKNPGDSGLTTTIEFDLPRDTTASEIQWPLPARHAMGPMMNYGYEDEILLPVRIMPSADLQPGEVFTLKGKADWLVCKEICIPESITFSFPLPVTENTPTLSQHASLFRDTFENIPQDIARPTYITITDQDITLTIPDVSFLPEGIIRDVYFFPENGLLINHAANQHVTIDDQGLTLTTERGGGNSADFTTIKGNILVKTDFDTYPFALKTTAQYDKNSALPLNGHQQTTTDDQHSIQSTYLDTPESDQLSFLTALIFAFMGGLILNLMPCVFPILSMKALHLVEHAHHTDKKHVRLGGLFYTFGVLFCFSLLGIVLLSLRATGVSIGWGIQLQSPTFVLILAYLMTIIGMLLVGAAEVGQSLTNIGHKLANKKGHTGSFFTGALAVIVATPCTAPFMGGAVFYALTQPWFISLPVLLSLGLGMALPFLLLALNPRFLSWLPRPGMWMQHFKQLLAFPMFGAAAWLIWVMSQQTGQIGIAIAMTGILTLSFGVWVFGTISADRKKNWWHWTKLVIVIISVLFSISLTFEVEKLKSDFCNTSDLPATSNWETFSYNRLENYQTKGQPVFVNMTAAWCITCLANERTTLSTDRVKTYFDEHGIVYLKGDWTNRDPEITRYLKEHNRSGVPLYIYYPSGYDGTKTPLILPQILTPEKLISALEKHEKQ